VIAGLGYERDISTMEVEFRSGRVYQYFMIPAAVFEALLHAESVGRYFNSEIRNRYPNREVFAE